MKNLINNWHKILLILFSLVPVLWFIGRGNAIVNGVDTNYPLNPFIWFIRRLYAWNDVSSAGVDFSSSVAGLFFHFLQVAFYSVTSNLQFTQVLTFIFWFSAIVLSSYFFASSMFEKNKMPRIVFVCLYAFNTYLFNTWENVKVSNLSLVVGLPLLLALFDQYSKGKLSLSKLAAYTVIAGVISSGSGINPAYFITLLVGIMIFSGVKVLLTNSLDKRKDLLRGFGVLIGSLLLVNAYWIIPTIRSIFFSDKSVTELSDIGFVNWLDSLSQNTSVLNVLRLIGAWDWYAFDESGQPLYIPYALRFIKWPPFIIFSLTLPFLALYSIVSRVKGKNPYYLFLVIMLVLGVFLGVGSHEPTGSVYKFLAERVPFLSFFRSPWYIFTPYLLLTISGLVALLFEYGYERLNNKSIATTMAAILVILNIIYCYPLVLGRIFRPTRHDSFYTNFPDYVFESSDYLSQNLDGRLISYPDDELEQFQWGYRGIESITNLFSAKETIFSSLNLLSPNSHFLLSNIYESLRRGEVITAESLAAKLNVNTLFLKTDQPSLAIDIQNYLQQYKVKEIGKWRFYDFPGDALPKIYTSTDLYFGYPFNNVSRMANGLSARSILLNPNDSVVAKIENVAVSSGKIVEAKNSQKEDYVNFFKQHFTFSDRSVKRDLDTVVFTFEIPQDGVFSPMLERYKLEEFGIDMNQPLTITLDGDRVVWQPEIVNNSFVRFKPVNFLKGKHEVSLELENNNLATLGVVGDYEREEISASYDIANFDPLRGYLISFEYRHLYGEGPAVLIEQMKGSHPLKRELTALAQYPELIPWSFYTQPVKSESSFKVKISTPKADESLGTKIMHENMQVYKVFDNDLLFIQDPGLVTVDNVNIRFEKVSPVYYKGEATSANKPHLFVFSENYSKDWKLKIKDNSPQTINPVHFSSNFYANTWFVDGTSDTYQFEIYYEPQRIYNIAKVVSGLSILGALFIVLNPVIRRRRNDS